MKLVPLVAGLVAALALTSAAVPAPKVGATLPGQKFSGDDIGFIKHVKDDAVYVPFDLKALTTGKASLVIYMAGRQVSEDMGLPLMEQFEKHTFPSGQFLSLIIVNMDDCTLGTCTLVQNSMEDLKPPLRYAIDGDGVGRKKLRLPEESFAAWLIDDKGVVVKARQGKFTKAVAKSWHDAVAAMVGAKE